MIGGTRTIIFAFWVLFAVSENHAALRFGDQPLASSTQFGLYVLVYPSVYLLWRAIIDTL